MEHRKKQRRNYYGKPDFPFLTRQGVVLGERRRFLERRTRNRQPALFKA